MCNVTNCQMVQQNNDQTNDTKKVNKSTKWRRNKNRKKNLTIKRLTRV